jgi:excisionase family DNA binding protein
MITNIIEERMISTSQVCKILNVTRITLTNWVKCGYIVCYRIGAQNKFKSSEIDDFIKNQKIIKNGN